MFQLNAPVVIRAKVKEKKTLVFNITREECNFYVNFVMVELICTHLVYIISEVQLGETMVCGRTWSAVVGVSTLVIVLLLLATRSEGTPAKYLTPGFRPPSVPLVVVDPYLRYAGILLNVYLSV